jgi:hypothetical protein
MGGIAAAINQLRKAFPKTVDAETLRKLSIAPKNESYVINVLRFIGAIDENGSKTEKAAAVFSQSGDEFKRDFAEMVKTAYAGLFDLHTDSAWTLSPEKLMSYFRSTDQTSELVGRHQAATFQLLAGFAGHGAPDTPKIPAKTKIPRPAKVTGGKAPAAAPNDPGKGEPQRDFGLTVRIEVNLPAGGDQETYDKIFRSIRENLFPNAK